MVVVLVVVRVAAVAVLAGVVVAAAAAAAGTNKSVEHAMYKRPRNLCYAGEITFSYFRIKAVCFLMAYYYDYEIKECEIVGSCTMPRRLKYVQKFSRETQREGTTLETEYGRVILNWNLRK